LNFLAKLFLPITMPIRFIQKNFKAVLFVTVVLMIFSNSNSKNLQQPNLQVINLTGAIMNASTILEELDEAKKAKNIKGVLIDINSPGGAVAPSVEIAYAIKELNTIKPVVVYASGTMTSGSYYSSIWASKIIANPGSMIGSIGVIMQSVDLSKLINKIGIKTQTIKMGKFKEIGTPTRQWTKYEKDELQKIIKNTYDMFVQDVSSARKLNIKDNTKFADAHIFTASQAQKVGLIDKVGTINLAKNELVILSKVKNPIWAKQDKIEQFIEKIIQKSILNLSIKLNTLVAY
jgi:protease-4